MPTDDVSELAKAEFQRLHGLIEAPGTAMRLWERVLTPDERQSLGGDIRAAFEPRGVVATWMKVRGGELPRALVDLAFEMEIISDQKRKWLLREIGEEPFIAQEPQIPIWNRDLGELCFNGSVVRKVRIGVAPNIGRILDAFQEESWPRHISDPLPHGVNPQRLRETVRTLNERLKAIVFHTDGTGEGVTWSRR